MHDEKAQYALMTWLSASTPMVEHGTQPVPEKQWAADKIQIQINTCFDGGGNQSTWRTSTGNMNMQILQRNVLPLQGKEPGMDRDYLSAQIVWNLTTVDVICGWGLAASPRVSLATHPSSRIHYLLHHFCEVN